MEEREKKISDILADVLEDAEATRIASDQLREEAYRIDRLVGEYASKVGMDHYGEKLAIKKGKKRGCDGLPWGIFRLPYEADPGDPRSMQPERNLADVPRADLIRLLETVPDLVQAWAKKVHDFRRQIESKKTKASQIADELEDGF